MAYRIFDTFRTSRDCRPGVKMQSSAHQTSGSQSSTAGIHAGYVCGMALVAAMGGLLFGYDWVVIGGAKPFYEVYFHLDSENLIGWANSCALIGCLIGALIAGEVGSRLGRKKVLLISALLFALSSLLTGWATSFTFFIVWRIVCGILAAQIANWLIAEKVPEGSAVLLQSWNAQFGWRWMFTAVAAPALMFFLLALMIPESPRWLVGAKRVDEARHVLVRIGGEEYAGTELAAIEESLHGTAAIRAG